MLRIQPIPLRFDWRDILRIWACSWNDIMTNTLSTFGNDGHSDYTAHRAGQSLLEMCKVSRARLLRRRRDLFKTNAHHICSELGLLLFISRFVSLCRRTLAA